MIRRRCGGACASLIVLILLVSCGSPANPTAGATNTPAIRSTPSQTPAPTPSPTTTAQSSAPTTIGKATEISPRPPQLLVRGRAGNRTTGVVVRLVRGGEVLRTAHAHIGGGHFRAVLSTAGLPRGRYRMQILLRRGRQELLKQRWISLA